MEIFYNRTKPNYEQIVDMGPKWWTEYREMDANYRFAGWTLDLMAYWLERIVQNQFVTLCDETTLVELEKVLRIQVENGSDWDYRRREVAAHFEGAAKISRSVIQQIVMAYTGADCNVVWEGTTLMIYIFSTLENDILREKMTKFLTSRLPAHIQFRFLFYTAYESYAQMQVESTVPGIEVTYESQTM